MTIPAYSTDARGGQSREGHNIPPRFEGTEGLAAASVEHEGKLQRLVADRWGRLLTTSDDEAAASAISYEYTYNTEGNIATETKVLGTERWTRSYTYDDHENVTGISAWSQA